MIIHGIVDIVIGIVTGIVIVDILAVDIVVVDIVIVDVLIVVIHNTGIVISIISIVVIAGMVIVVANGPAVALHFTTDAVQDIMVEGGFFGSHDDGFSVFNPICKMCQDLSASCKSPTDNWGEWLEWNEFGMTPAKSRMVVVIVGGLDNG